LNYKFEVTRVIIYISFNVTKEHKMTILVFKQQIYKKFFNNNDKEGHI